MRICLIAGALGLAIGIAALISSLRSGLTLEEAHMTEFQAMATPYFKPGDTYIVVAEPKPITGIDWAQRVVVEPKKGNPGEQYGLFAALLVPPRPLSVGAEVQLQKIEFWGNLSWINEVLVVKSENVR
ncbi:MAG TPA: hypothetical protein VJC05_02510 [Candidatus Andersenbacteria bacterium]|nr:MAG: hypothetical protein A2854_01850 [Parcubacteria group bacterium RIFCSPHIGHO2_01_FULL_56_18]HLD25888.1 hypothetical protein [Candidatus Andersenbacteria bacterium]